MLSNVYLLKNYENLFGESPSDKFLIARDVTLSGSSGSVNLLGLVQRGESVSYLLMKHATVHATTGVLTVTAAVPTASEAVTALIVIDVGQLAKSGEG